ncbi:DUF2790 domain-containing protein [Pseudomonas fluorescens]|uniref:DUF2790 domain-containing protein n=1 Tax=Pseudomonas fluorescens TaxID=294 RepID=UPI003F7AC026
MSLSKLSTVSLTLSLSSITFAESRGDRNVGDAMEANQKSMAAYAAQKGKTVPDVQKYRDGMKLDIAKVVSTAPPIRSCNVVPFRMTYEDSAGKLPRY